jgi:hypothetical protein
MMRLAGIIRVAAAVILLPVMLAQRSFAWGHDGHQMINRVAVASLPADVPEFLRKKAAQNAMDFYGPQPDHWRTSNEPELEAAIAPDHFMDMEYADLVGPFPRDRFSFIRTLAAAQASHPEIKMTAEGVGLLPYAILENYERLKITMRDYRRAVAAKQDTRPAEAEIVVLAGILGHFVADGSQPLHTTIQYNGWVGLNPNDYTTAHKIHGEFEGDFVHDNVKATDIAALVVARPVAFSDVFTESVAHLRRANALVEETYQLEKAGAFAGAGTPEGKAFADERLAAGATELRDMIYTAWVRSGDPVPVSKWN